MRRISYSIYVLTIVVVIGFHGSACKLGQKAPITADFQLLGIMSYNVENLFDTQHDPGKFDFTHLPLVDKKDPEVKAYCAGIERKKWRTECETLNWDAPTFAAKLKQISQRIDLQKSDLLFLQEVENERALHALNKMLKHPFSYHAFLEGPDQRGIDTAILSRFPLSHISHRAIPFRGMSPQRRRDTRPLLVAKAQLSPSLDCHLYSVHLPAPYHSPWFRSQALKFIYEQTLDQDCFIIAGDFNVTAGESFKKRPFAPYEKHWLLSDTFLETGDIKGSYYYGRGNTWSFLDKIILSRHFVTRQAWTVSKNSRVITGGDTRPQSFNPITHEGASDHWPIYLEISAKQKK